jgi:phosphohistidine phosphatase
MPTLLVLRHGKSDWRADYGLDTERPLAKRGRRAAKSIGRHLADVGPEPTLALTSPAVRARQTLDRVLEAGRFDCPVQIVESFYGRGVTAVLHELRALDGSPEAVLIVGHEPTWSDLIATLTGSDVTFPTAALARLDLDARWAELSPGCAGLTWLVRPRELEASES